jgi:hypothetical protein
MTHQNCETREVREGTASTCQIRGCTVVSANASFSCSVDAVENDVGAGPDGDERLTTTDLVMMARSLSPRSRWRHGALLYTQLQWYDLPDRAGSCRAYVLHRVGRGASRVLR